MSRPKKINSRIEGAKSLGIALTALRRSRGLNMIQLSQACGSTRSSLSRYELGKQVPREDTLRPIMQAIGLPTATLFAMQRHVERLSQGRRSKEGDPDDDGTLPDARQRLSRHHAMKLAQEAGKAVAHCCLAFMELQAGWAQEERRDGGDGE
jgi:transcriptional regulator with XRE-family HTH domain